MKFWQLFKDNLDESKLLQDNSDNETSQMQNDAQSNGYPEQKQDQEELSDQNDNASQDEEQKPDCVQPASDSQEENNEGMSNGGCGDKPQDERPQSSSSDDDSDQSQSSSNGTSQEQTDDQLNDYSEQTQGQEELPDQNDSASQDEEQKPEHSCGQPTPDSQEENNEGMSNGGCGDKPQDERPQSSSSGNGSEQSESSPNGAGQGDIGGSSSQSGEQADTLPKNPSEEGKMSQEGSSENGLEGSQISNDKDNGLKSKGESIGNDICSTNNQSRFNDSPNMNNANQRQGDSTSDSSYEEEKDALEHQPESDVVSDDKQLVNPSENPSFEQSSDDDTDLHEEAQKLQNQGEDTDLADELKPDGSDMNGSEDLNDSQDSLEQEIDDPTTRKEKLQALRDALQKIASLKSQSLNNEKKQTEESVEKKYDSINNEFISKLNELTPFQDRERGAGYSIDKDGNVDIPNSVIRVLIVKFLNQRFCKKETDLNVRANSFDQSYGFHRWDVKSVVIHLKTHQLTKVLTDKYGYKYADGKSESVPLSFYFDLSGSMSSYSNLLATIAMELLKKGVKVLVGFNERVNVQIDSIKETVNLDQLAQVLEEVSDYNYEDLISEYSNIKMKLVNRNIDNYLLNAKAEKCVVFSDFDPLHEVINLSQGCKVYWFCFESSFTRADLSNFNGFMYKVQNMGDIAKGLLKVNEYRFETLCYLEDGPGKVKK